MFTDDQDIERQLKAELNVVPSAGFDAAVRRRIGAETVPRPLWPAWVAAAAVLALAFAGWYLARQTESAEVQRLQAVTAPDVSLPRPTPPPEPAVASSRPKPLRTTRVSEPLRSARGGQLEVIVPPGQLEMIRRFVAQVNAGRIDVPDTPVAPAGPVELEVPPLIVMPIPVSSAEPGGGAQPIAKGLQ